MQLRIFNQRQRKKPPPPEPDDLPDTSEVEAEGKRLADAAEVVLDHIDRTLR